MQRRKFLVGLGSLAASGAAVMGSGAFSQTVADRTLNVQAQGDAAAYLQLKSSNSPNGDYAKVNDNDQLELDFTGSNGNVPGGGVNRDSKFRADDVFNVKNAGTQPVYVTAEIADGNVGNNPSNRAFVYPRSARTRPLDRKGRVVKIAVGNSEDFGIGFNVNEEGGNLKINNNDILTITANVSTDSANIL